MNKQNKKAACILIVKEKQFLAVSLKKDHTDLNLPGGKVEPGETMKQCAVREMKEETGLTINKENLVELYTSTCDGYVVTTFYASTFKGKIETEEDHVVQWMPFEALNKSKTWPNYNKNVLKSYLSLISDSS